ECLGAHEERETTDYTDSTDWNSNTPLSHQRSAICGICEIRGWHTVSMYGIVSVDTDAAANTIPVRDRRPAAAADGGVPYPGGPGGPRAPRLLDHAGRRRADRRQGAAQRRHALQRRQAHARAGPDRRAARQPGPAQRRRAPPVLWPHAVRTGRGGCRGTPRARAAEPGARDRPHP